MSSHSKSSWNNSGWQNPSNTSWEHQTPASGRHEPIFIDVHTGLPICMPPRQPLHTNYDDHAHQHQEAGRHQNQGIDHISNMARKSYRGESDLIIEELGKSFPELDPGLVTSIFLTAPNPGAASDMLREIQAGKDAAGSARAQDSPSGTMSIKPSQQEQPDNLDLQWKLMKGENEQDGLRQQLNLSQETVQELLEEQLPHLTQQLNNSQAAVQDLLEREFPMLTTKVVAVTLRDYDYDVVAAREVLKSLMEV